MEKEYFIRALEQIRSVVDIKITTLGKLDNGIVQGNIQFRNENILVEFDTEKEAPLMADFNILAQQLKKLLSYFNENNYESFIHDISCQTVYDIYQQLDITQVELKKECDTFQKNMTLKSIKIFPNFFILIYDIKFDKEQLYIQLNTTYSIEEIMIN
ncbi:MAG: hypothetical protein EGQ00_08400 [Parabacteroides johnsonii]|nr:hypothetical protein [Parabacteroides johnsonii]